MLFVSFAFGCLASIRQVTGFIFFLELMPQKSNTAAVSIFSIIDGLTYLLLVIYFWLINKHWFWIILVGYIFQITGAFLAWWLPESPPFLFSMNRYEEAIKVFALMARVNRRQDFNVSADEIRARIKEDDQDAVSKQEAPSTLHFLKQRRIQINLGIMMVVWLASSFDYYLILFLVNSFKRVYACAFASSISEFVAYATSGILFAKFGAKISFSCSFASSFIGGVVILAYGL